MKGEKLAIRAILRCEKKNELRARIEVKEMNNDEGPGTVNGRIAQNWFRSIKEAYTSLENKSRSRGMLWKMKHCLKWLNNIQALEF